MKTVAIVQARTGSTRLPGKVLLPLAGRPVLWHLVQRLNRARTLDTTVIATSELKQDDPIAEAAETWGINCYRGSRTDVLARHYEAAATQNADTIVRIPADKPLVHPALVDQAVHHHLRAKADYTSNTPSSWPTDMTFPFGLEVEVVSWIALASAHESATKPEDREHVLPFIYQRPAMFKIERIVIPMELARPEFRLALDTPEDYQLLTGVYQALWTKDNPILSVDSVLAFLDSHPEIATLNAEAVQKGVE